MNTKFILIGCCLFLSGAVLAQDQETVDNSNSNSHQPALPGNQNTIQLAAGVVLYDNGSMVNSPGSGVGGLDESILQSVSLGMNTLGAGHQALNDNRVADDFVVPAGGWDISQIEFFAYQTGETASTITAVNLRIWDGLPGQAGSNVVFGDTSTNIMSQTAATNILRVSETTNGADSSRQVAVNVVDINSNLPAGTYWLDWQSDGSGGSGPWAPPITITGNDTTGDALQSTDGGVTYGPLNDSGTLTQQGLPFIIYGSPPMATQVPAMTPWGLMTLLVLMLLLGRRFNRQ